MAGTLSISSIPFAAYAQGEPSPTTTSPLQNGQSLTESSSRRSAPTAEEKISRLDAAVLTTEHYDGEDADSNQIRLLRRLAQAYSALGEQTRAVELLDQATAIAQDSESRFLSPIRIVPTYIKIGETEKAEALLDEAIAASDYIQTRYLLDIAAASVFTENTELAASALSQAVDYLESSAAEENSRGSVYSVGSIAQAYSRLGDETAAEEGLSRLVALIDAEVETDAIEDRSRGRLATALSQLSIAQSEQGNTDSAEALALQAMEIIRDGEQTGYIAADVAAAYGYIEDIDVAEQALLELTQLAMDDLSSNDPIGPVSALRAIAIAYEQKGNTEKSEEALAVVTETFGDSLYMLGAILGIYTDMENVAAQETTIQQMFDKLPLLREAGLVVSDVTSGYAGIDGVVEGYIQTVDDELAQERLAMLERFFKEVQFDPLDTPGQLAILARAAARREDYATAQRLLAEATQQLETDSDFCQERCVSVIGRLANGYTWLEDDQAKQDGFDRLQQVADDNLDPEQRDSVSSLLTRARTVF